jgi:hypothetical protein
MQQFPIYILSWTLHSSPQLGEGAGITRLHLQRRLPGLRSQTEQKAGHQISR